MTASMVSKNIKMATAIGFTSQSGQSKIPRLSPGYTMCTLWISVLIITTHLPRTLAQIEDIILDLEDPDDYVDEVVANLEREQADRERHQVEASARCRVRCLAERQMNHHSGHKPAALDRCLNDNACTEEHGQKLKTCLKPCSQPFANLAFCEHICQNDASGGCEDSCLFLQNIYTQKPGQCPSIDQLTGYGALCIEACLVDSDCPEEDQKCCYNGCGHVCAQPSHNLRGVPLVPDQPRLSELRPEGAVLLEWNSVAANRTGPVLYIVWVRWNVGKHHSDAHMTHWQQIKQTTDTTTVIKEISPGHWYQYQVSAVNINGSHGASPPTRAFCLSREPAPPSVPVNLTEGSTLVQGNHVTVSVMWKHPIISDIPVSKYKVFWSRYLSKHPNIPGTQVREHRQVISGDQLQFDLPDLDPEATYLVQIQAICQYGDTRLRSDRAAVYINTYPLSKAAQIVLTTTASPVEIVDLHTPQRLTGVTVESPFFQNGLLRANVSWSVIQGGHGTSTANKALLKWSPEACISDSVLNSDLPKQLSATTQDQYFVIYELRFDCRYVVHVMPISDYGAISEESRMTFVTPSCGEVAIVGYVKPDCPPRVPRVPEEPANLHHSFIINSVNISAHLAWDPPLSDSPVTGYRVTWGQTLPNNPNVWDKNTVLTKVLQKESRNFRLDRLHEAFTYLVRIQALSRMGPGKVAISHFRAPVLTATTQKGASSVVLTPYDVIEEPPGRGNNHGGNLPITAKPHSWSPNSAKSSHSASIGLQTICLTLCIVATIYTNELFQQTSGDVVKRAHLRHNNNTNLPSAVTVHHVDTAKNNTFGLPVRFH